MNIEELITYGRESTNLDFKQTYYPSARRADLISDIMAMANAETRDDRHIIFGVKLQPDGTKTFHSIATYPDPAEIEQLILQNIEPMVHIEFVPFEIEGHSLAYLRIYNCEDQPYLMRKDYSPLTQGTGKIRKGTATLSILRSDLDRMFNNKNTNQDLRAFIKI